ncbi:MAG: helix-turn-helix domain-containing protein [Rubrobacteraceae bacterium]|jgi:excisionase family DNA binding protein|nr:helix-turn-helix domain-containing protein [Rubrobacteraceae bacterium]
MEERYLSLSDAADALDISERTAYRWIKLGKLRAYKPGRDYRIPEAALKEAVEASEVHPKAESPSSLEPSLFNGFEEGWNLKASYWIECLNTQADLCEQIIARGGYDLETMWHLEGAAIELWGAYSKTVRRLVREWASPGQVAPLQRAEARMRAARTATRQAYGECRDAEEDRQKVVDLDARRQLREARYTDQGYANAGM